MQHKSLFAAMMLGALVLASCVKNEESQSVKDIRRARAEEIRTQAELNMANVQATITLANAQAAIAAAEAKLKEAEAAIAMAEAAKKLAEAELIEVQVQIAQVQLQEEQVKLLAKRAELEKLIAQYEAEIAQYEADKQAALNKLAKAEMEAEINEIKMARKLIEEEESLMKAMAKLGAEKEKQINEIWLKYSAQVTALNAAQHQLITKQVQLAKLEASVEPVSEIILEQIEAKMNEISAKERYIETLKEQVLMTESELKASIEVVKAAYAEAKAEELTAAEEMDLIGDRLNDMMDADLVYEQNWDIAFVNWFENLNWDANGVYSVWDSGSRYSIFCKGIKMNEETGRFEMGVYFFFPSATPNSHVMDNEFYPLYTCEISGDYQSRWTADAITVPGFNYPYSVDGAEPTYQTWIQPVVYSPAKVYVENFYELIACVEYYEQWGNEDQLDYLNDYIGYAQDRISGKIEDLGNLIAAYTAYVEEAEKEIKPAQIAVALANQEIGVAKANADEAYSKYSNYYNTHDITPEAENELSALNDYRRALDNYDRAQTYYNEAAIVLFGAVPNFEATDEGDGGEGDEGAVEGLIDKVVRMEKEAYEAALITAEKEHAMNEAYKDVDPELEQAIETAKTNLKNQVDVVIAKEKAEEAALIAWHIAEIEYKADPTDAKKTAAEGKKTEWETAVEATNTEKDKLPALKQAVSDAKAAWDAVSQPYQEAVKAYNSAKAVSDKLYADWQTAKAELGEKDDAPAQTGSAYAVFKYAANLLETTQGQKENAFEALKNAHEANPDDTSEFNQLWMDYLDAWAAVAVANTAAQNARNELNKLFRGPDAKYPSYTYRKTCIESDYAEDFSDDFDDWLYYYLDWAAYFVGETVPENVFYMPGQPLAQYYWYMEQSENLQAIAAKWFEKTDFAIYEKTLDEVRERLMVYDTEEEDYMAFIEQMQEIEEAQISAKMTYARAKNESIAPATALQVLNEFLGAKIYSSTGSDELAISELEAKIRTAGLELKALEEELIDLRAQLDLGMKDKEGKYTAVKIAELQNEIQKLQVEMEMRAALIDQYLEILGKLLSVVE